MEDLQRYRDTLRRRGEEEQRRREDRAARAGDVANQAAQVLREQFGAERVVLFGSAAAEKATYAPSDVDLAVWGLSGTAHLEAVATLQDCSPALAVDVIRMERCPSELRDVILQEGREL